MLRSLLRRTALRKRALALLSALAIIATGGVIATVATPAQAVWTDCPAGQMCLWTGNYASGTRYDFAWSTWQNGGGCNNVSSKSMGIVNTASSIHNGYGGGAGAANDVRFYTGANCTGDVMTIIIPDSFGGDRALNEALYNTYYNNNIEAFRVANYG